jgi:hypothetical protein
MAADKAHGPISVNGGEPLPLNDPRSLQVVPTGGLQAAPILVYLAVNFSFAHLCK